MEKQVNSGFKFQGKLVFLFLCFLVYVGLELALNLLLIELYSQPVETVFSEKTEAIHNLDLFGRTLSSFGLALAIVSSFPLWRFAPNVNKEKAKALHSEKKAVPLTEKQALKAKWLARPLVFFLIWMALIPALRLVVDGIVHNTDNNGRLNAVRAIIYKEGYLSGAIQIDGADKFNQLVSNSEKRKLVLALIPSLAYFSNSFNKLIEQNMENIADTFLRNHQKQQFAQAGLPKLRAFDRVYQDEFNKYRAAQKKHRVALDKLNDRASILQEQQALVNAINDEIQMHWDSYAERYASARKDYKQLSKNDMLRKRHHEFKDQHRSRGCNLDCEAQVEMYHADYFNNLKYESGESLGILVKPEDIEFSTYGTEERILQMLQKGRKRWLKLDYGVGEHQKFEEFVISEEARKLVIKKFKSKGVDLPSDWQLNNTALISEILTAKYRDQLAKVWKNYLASSQFKINEKSLDKIAFAQHKKINSVARRSLGTFYINGFSPAISERDYVKRWIAQQDNISFIRMINSTASVAAFSPGGSLYDIGNDAVKLAVVLPFSVILSFLAIFVLCIKFGRYLLSREAPYHLVALGALSILAFILPVMSSIGQKGSYQDAMASFAEKFNEGNSTEYNKTVFFGVALDFENGLYQKYHDWELIKALQGLMFESNSRNSAESEVHQQQKPLLNLVTSYDDAMYKHFSWLPNYYGAGNIQHFDVNITVLKRDHTIGAFLGLNLKNGKVNKVTMPNFLENKDLALLAEQRFFYNPDIIGIAKTFVDNYENGDYLLSLSNGSFMRESAISKLEKSIKTVINSQTRLLNAVNELKRAGNKNLVLIQMNRSESYQCFAAPNIMASSLASAVNTNNYQLKPIKNCKGVLSE
ncbi:hypothetical protein [Parashewanella tropica]|uniref:hypothetical protein n=1 Tax=Parashewanella tropica TaxID=2547970 RepID=UPI0010592523|nr:hypothetical protein [Parashewanella tropica]